MFLCDFHREKAWCEWLKKADNGASQCKDEILRHLRSIAHSSTGKKFEENVKLMKDSVVWKSCSKLQKWQEGKCLPDAKVNLTLLCTIL